MNALVLGGTGPTGPYIVNGLLERGYKVTIMHGGFHEVEFAAPVEDLHGDVHFKETLEQTLGNRTFDLILFTYGRLRVTAEFAIGRTGRFIAVSAGGEAAGPKDPRWGPLGRPLVLSEDNLVVADPEKDRFGYLIYASNQRALELHQEGHYNATVIGYPNLYGPRQLAPEDWSVIRRILDGRKQLIIADGGLKIHSRAYVENAAHAVLLAVDKPKESAGQQFNVLDETIYTMRQRIDLICKTMNWEMELVDMPFHLAKPCHYLFFGSQEHYIRDSSKIRQVLGYKDPVPAAEAMQLTVKWLLENRPERGGEEESQMDDPFDYKAEDELIRVWKEAADRVSKVYYPKLPPAHRYRHPRTPGEAWHRPESTKTFGRRNEA